MRASLFGCPIDVLSMPETVDLVRSAMAKRQKLHHVALNVAKLINMRSDPELAADVKRSDIIGIDGMGIVLGARCMGLDVRERVAGIDLMNEVLRLCAEQGRRPYLLGATPAVLKMAAATIKARHPAIEFAGIKDGYFKPDEEAGVIEDIRASHADCLFVAMPTPRKERLLAAYGDRLDVPFIMGVGGSFDVVAGHVQRAPGVMQRFGLEWLYRVYQEPRRMWWRYVRTNTIFVFLLAKAIIHRAVSGTGEAHAKG